MGDYRKYLATKDWKQTRAYRVALAGGRCEECGADRVLQAHHNTYDRVEREMLDDLDVLCRPCHMREHGTQPKERPMSATNGAVTETTVETTPASVTIRTLSVRGSSMTLAVYRQLPERKLISDSGKFNGTPWGTVNLCPSRDCPENERTHWHVVWETDGSLYRDVCRKPLRFKSYHDASEGFAALYALHAPARISTKWQKYSNRHFLVWSFVEGIPPVECRLPSGDLTTYLSNAEPPVCDRNGCEHGYCEAAAWKRAERAVSEAAGVACDEWDISHVSEMAALIQRDLEEEYACHVACVARWNELEALPQLFLGV